jgi:acetyl esterase/lipase
LGFREHFNPECNGYWVEETQDDVAQGLKEDKVDLVMIHFHGGGFSVGNPLVPYVTLQAWQKMMAAEGKRMAIFTMGYDLAPVGRYPAVTRQVLGQISLLCAQVDIASVPVIVSGDSAGGHLAMHISPHLDLKHTTLLLSPWIHISNSSDHYKTNEGYDYLPTSSLTKYVDLYLGPFSAPVPPTKSVVDTLVITGDRELFHGDIVAWCRQAESEGANITLIVGEGQLHCYALMQEMCVGKGGHARHVYEYTMDAIRDWMLKQCV